MFPMGDEGRATDTTDGMQPRAGRRGDFDVHLTLFSPVCKKDWEDRIGVLEY